MTIQSYLEYIQATSNDRLAYFIDTLSKTNRTPEYYVNWNKVKDNARTYELELNTLNYLIRKPNIYSEAMSLFIKQPNLIKAIPSLIASRDKVLDVLAIDNANNMDFYTLDFNNIDTGNIKSYVDFAKESGLLSFLQNEASRTLVDYVYGVEVGLDSNARKNRSGSLMEEILNRHIVKVCNKLNFKHHSQATAKYIKDNWGVNVPVDKSERSFDEAVFDPITKRVWIIETNYYGGGGSKLKSVSGEFITLNNLVRTSKDDITFVWVTDGQGWHTARIPLSEAFDKIAHIFNLNMLSKNYLECLFC